MWVRFLPPAQRLRVLEKFKQKLQEEAKEKASESRSNFHGNQYQVVSSPNGEHTKIRTDKELIYDFIAKCGRATRAEVQEELGFKLTKTRNILLQLEQEGKIERHGNGKGIFYTFK